MTHTNFWQFTACRLVLTMSLVTGHATLAAGPSPKAILQCKDLLNRLRSEQAALKAKLTALVEGDRAGDRTVIRATPRHRRLIFRSGHLVFSGRILRTVQARTEGPQIIFSGTVQESLIPAVRRIRLRDIEIANLTVSTARGKEERVMRAFQRALQGHQGIGFVYHVSAFASPELATAIVTRVSRSTFAAENFIEVLLDNGRHIRVKPELIYSESIHLFSIKPKRLSSSERSLHKHLLDAYRNGHAVSLTLKSALSAEGRKLTNGTITQIFRGPSGDYLYTLRFHDKPTETLPLSEIISLQAD